MLYANFTDRTSYSLIIDKNGGSLLSDINGAYAPGQYVNLPVEIDEQTLTQIAGTTEANYFRATSNSKLKEVYEEIDKLEKTKLHVKEFSKKQEEYLPFALAAFLVLLLEIILRNVVLRRLP